VISKLTISDINQVAKIHRKELTGFLPELGEGFLQKFYRHSLEVAEMFSYVVRGNEDVLGFVSATTSAKGLYKKIIFKDLVGYGLIILRYFITHFDKLGRIGQFFFYPGFKQHGPELLILAVTRDYQRRGIGKNLFKQVALEFKRRGIRIFKVSTYDKLPANGFYKKIGCKFEYSFNYMGEKMNYYSYKTRISKSEIRNNIKIQK